MRSALAGVMILLPAVAHAQAAPKLKLSPSAIVLKPGQTADPRLPITIIAGFTEEELKKIPPSTTPSLIDRTPRRSSTTVTATFDPAGSRLTGTTQVWNFTLSIAGFPEYDSEARTLLATHGPVAQTLDYTIANTFSRTFSWVVRMPSEWNVRHQRTHGLSVSVGDVPASEVALHQVELVSQDARKITLGRDHFQLCGDGPGDCPAVPAELAPRQPQMLHLRTLRSLPPGQFHGTVAIRAKEKVEPESLAIKIYSPHPRGELYGALALAAGVLTSLLLQIAGRALLTWLGQRRTRSLLRARHRELQLAFDSLPHNLRTAASAWQRNWDSVATMIDDLRGQMTSPVAVPSAADETKLDEFKKAAEAITARFPHASLLLDGLMRVKDVHTRTRKTALCEQAATDISLVQEDDETPKKAVTQIVTKLRQDTGDARSTFASVHEPEPDPRVELRRVNVLLGTVSVALWLVWAAISVLTGLAILVLQNPAFGTLFDLIACALWGLSISVIGQQASALTPSGIRSTIGITVPGGKP